MSQNSMGGDRVSSDRDDREIGTKLDAKEDVKFERCVFVDYVPPFIQRPPYTY